MVRCIWLTIEIHGVMEEMIKHGISSNSAINAAFVRFLTKQVAVTAGTSVSKADGKAESKAESWRQKVSADTAKALTVAAEAKNIANGAQVLANKVRDDVKNLYAKNTDIKK
jgi:hypothetical protein